MIQEPYDGEVGAGTMGPETFLRVLGPDPYRVAYVQPVESIETVNISTGSFDAEQARERYEELLAEVFPDGPAGAREVAHHLGQEALRDPHPLGDPTGAHEAAS